MSIKHKVRVTFLDDDSSWSEAITLLELSKLSTTATSKIQRIDLSTGLHDRHGNELFIGDTYKCTNHEKKQEDGSYRPVWETYTLNDISDLYGSPFRAGKSCVIIKDK